MRPPRPLVVLAAVALVAAPAAPARAADETIAELARPTPVDAWAGRIAYSAYDPAADRFALTLKTGAGAPAPLPVAPERSAFDVDLGRGPNGDPSAIYPRCNGVEQCDLYVLDLVTQRERKLRGASTRASEFAPTISGTRIAFVRRTGAGRERIVVRSLGSGRERRVASPSRGGGATALELRGRSLAFTWGDRGGDLTTQRIFLQRLGGRRVLVDRASSGLLSTVETMQPAFEGGAIFYAVARRLASGNHFGRYDIATGRTRDVVSRGRIISAGFDGGRFTFVQTPYDEGGENRCEDPQGAPAPCLLKRTPPIAF